MGIMSGPSGSVNKGKPSVVVQVLVSFTLAVGIVSCLPAQPAKEIIRTYGKKDTLRINGISGSRVHISSGGQAHIEIRLNNHGNPEFRYSIQERNDAILISEDIINYDGGRPTPRSNYRWSIVLPQGMYVEIDGATFALQLTNFSGTCVCQGARCHGLVENVRGRVEIHVAEFDIRVVDSQGAFNVTAANGDLEADRISLTGPSVFTTGNGDIEIGLAETARHNLLVGSASGRAILNYNDNPVAGAFEFIARADKGRIVCPYRFDVEEVFKDEKRQYKTESDFGVLVDYNRKTLVRASRDPKITLKTITGIVKLVAQ
jgi:hypothetical protein